MAQPIPSQIGRYEILELVGRGGMGVLYRAKDPTLERVVALKMMLVDFTHDQSARERFEREAKAVARLQHRNVVTIHELGETDGTPFIVMEFLSGQDLEHLVRGSKPLTVADKLDIVAQLCEGLGYAHEQGIVHRDIKPGNVRVLEDGTVKILDFGIAKFAMSSMTQSGTIMGTAHYMAPEQIMGNPIDGRADLFSAGVLLHELLTGQKPFGGDSPTAVVYQIMNVEPPPVRAVVPDLPDALNDIVARALKKNPEERYARASEMASDLQIVKMMADLPLTAEGTPDPNAPKPATGKLFATSVAMKTLSMPARDGVAAGTGGAGTAPVTRGGGKTGLIAAAAAVVILGGAAALYFSGGSPPASGAPAPASGATGTVAPASGAPAQTAAPAATPAGADATADVVVINSVPPGARISLNGVDTGKSTPAAVSLGGQVPGKVELALKGFQTLAGAISEADLRRGNKEFRLAREAGPVRLTVSAPYPFEVVQGSRVLSAAAERHEVTIQPGGAAVSARNTDLLLNAPLAIDFARPQADVTLPAPGILAVFASVETCSVIVDGQDLGFPPIPRKAVASGAHTVTLRCKDGKEDTRKVTIPSGERVPVTFGPPRGEGAP